MATSVAIIGGGIGGLAAALSLLRAGVDVHVYEQTRTLREIGAGIQVTPNASRILQRLGLTDESATYGVKPQALQQRRWDDGSVLRTTPLAESIESACGAPYYQSHRADLLNSLLSRLPAERLRAAGWHPQICSIIEDGATLAGCLTKVASQDIPDALRLYESLRAPRAARVQAASSQNKTRFHFPDGPLQRQRDTQIRDAANDWFIEAIGWIYQYDAGAPPAR